MNAQTGREPRQKQVQQRPPETTAQGGANLTQRYRAIGIASVAAAARYVGQPKKPAHAPVSSQPDERFVETAA